MQWKIIPGFNDLYRVSDTGLVESRGRWNRENWKPLARTPNCRLRYLTCGLWLNNKMTRIPVHRLVALAFLPKPEGTVEVNHIDGDRQNNNVTNLEWISHLENIRHTWRSGRGLRGSQRSEAVINEDIAVKIRCLHYLHGFSEDRCDRMFNYRASGSVIRGLTWTHV